MTTLKLPDDTLVLVTTGREAKLFRVKDGRLAQKDHWKPSDLADDGPGGSTPPEYSPNEVDEATFANQVAQRLYGMAHKHKFTGLVLIADPQTLGQMRPLLHQAVTEKIIAEHAKTFINSPIADIERLLAVD